MSLEGKVVIVTGGGRGIGRAAALLCAREGASVIVNDPGVARDGSGADSTAARQVAEEIQAAGGKAYPNFASIADAAGAIGVVEDALSQFGRIDAIVNAAGILRDAWWHRMTREDWYSVIDVHLNGAFNICRVATPHFREQRSGSFVHFTSGAGLVGNRGQANYSAAKLGVVGLSQSIALDMARFGVRSNCIAPVAWTRMVQDTPDEQVPEEEGDPGRDDGVLAHMRADLGAEKIAPLIAFLASDASADVSGQVFGVTGNEIVLFSRPQPVASMTRDEGWSPASIAEQMLPAFRDSFVDGNAVAGDGFKRD